METSIIVNIILSVLSFALATISVITVVITLKQNNKMLEANSRPYVVAYLVYQEDPSYIYLCVKNFGNTSAIVKSMKITPSLSLYKKSCNEIINNTMIAPNQQMHFIISDENKKEILYNETYVFSVELEYKDCCTEKNYKESYDINMEYATTVLSTRPKMSNVNFGENSLYNIERTLTYMKNSNM